MLSGETAVGKYPIRAVEVLDLVIRDAELIPPALSVQIDPRTPAPPHARPICEAAVTLANRGEAAAIVAITRGGKTARLLSALRPRAPIYAVTDQQPIARRLALHWGVVPVMATVGADVNEIAARIGGQLVERGVIPPASVIVLVRVTPDLSEGSFLRLLRV
jgi:pyruvate kinase